MTDFQKQVCRHSMFLSAPAHTESLKHKHQASTGSDTHPKVTLPLFYVSVFITQLAEADRQATVLKPKG